ncbi:MAG: hypothetical protein KAJ95_09645, partial [Gammaproteobacteria bacterium]|nr:hypothetical protein [Gammaproteobacteria bacterium]
HLVNAYELVSFTPTRVYVNAEDMVGLAVGDHIELDWDGIVRTITAKANDGGNVRIDYTPGSPRIQYKSMLISNWKAVIDYTLDLTPLPASPALGNGSGCGNIGSSVNVVDYRNCDFDGDGVRDVPEYTEDPGLAGYGPW